MGLEIGRRLVHASGAVVPGAYLLDTRILETGLLTWSAVQALAVVGLLVIFGLEAARLYGGFDHPIYERLAREYEQDTVAGYAMYALGATVTVFVFEPTLAVPALFMLTLGDPVSGMLSGGTLRRIARLRVLVGMFSVCLLLASPFVPLYVAVAGALGATVADGVKPMINGYVVDDNLTIPLFAGGAMWVALVLG
ncbi:dolichol kinase [Natronomonas sp. LN261]|jgi:dolichol kinase|uniref:dolichol kinase n=1 Tax=Natronomonas sp. LN261 TaxID=2750669 RepID=UPI0015EEC7DB|nr:dolichol kinase [Natronomonas sp. LN261]